MRALPPIIMSEQNIRSFWQRVDKRGPDECWHWNGTLTSAGYGALAIRSREKYRAHRIAYFLASGLQPDGFVCHRCDNPKCVNPAHLWLGDAKSNNIDRDLKGRNGHGRKSHCPSGHPYDERNTKYYRNTRSCRACNALNAARLRVRRKAALRHTRGIA